jgi:hypothetical protein
LLSVTRSRAGFSRRLFTLLLMLGFGLFNVESLIADACDGDADQIAVAASVDGPTDTRSGGSEVPSGHAIHVCHCVHAHGGLPARFEHVTSASDIRTLVTGFLAPALADPARELELRPPIA